MELDPRSTTTQIDDAIRRAAIRRAHELRNEAMDTAVRVAGAWIAASARRTIRALQGLRRGAAPARHA